MNDGELLPAFGYLGENDEQNGTCASSINSGIIFPHFFNTRYRTIDDYLFENRGRKALKLRHMVILLIRVIIVTHTQACGKYVCWFIPKFHHTFINIQIETIIATKKLSVFVTWLSATNCCFMTQKSVFAVAGFEPLNVVTLDCLMASFDDSVSFLSI